MIETNTIGLNCIIDLLEVGSSELESLSNLLLESRDGLVNVSLLSSSDVLGDGNGSLNSLTAELALGGEELATEDVLLNVSGLDDSLLTVQTLEDRSGEGGSSVSHGQSSRTSTLLSGDDLITSELDSLGDGGHVQLGDLVIGQLAQQGNDGGSGVSTNHGDVAVSRAHAEGLSDELASTDGIELSDSHNLARIVDAHLLEGLREDRDGGVHGVANDQDASLRASSGASLSQVHGNTSVGVEQIVSGHTGLSGDSGGDDDDIRAIEDLQEVVLTVVSLDLAVSVNVGKIHSNTGGAHNIVEGEARNQGVHSHQQRHGLTNTSSSSEDGDLSALPITHTSFELH